VAKAREIAGLDPDHPYQVVADRVVEVRASEVIEHSERVLDTDDIERVHDMRVATRRLRAALEIFEPCFGEERHRVALREVKAIADALGERRDRDVTIEALERFAEGLPAADRRGIDGLVERIRDEQREANHALAGFVRPERLRSLREQIRELVEAR
jgi:CHAD domain-containing protein